MGEFNFNLRYKMLGGKKQVTEMEPEVVEIINGCRPKVEESEGKFDNWEVIGYATQVVAGMVLYPKVKVGHEKGEHVWIKIFVPLPHTQQPPEVQQISWTE